MLTYARRISEVSGAKPVRSKLDAFTFGPDVLPGVAADIAVILEQLVSDLAGDA